jgi:hypothetical protein
MLCRARNTAVEKVSGSRRASNRTAWWIIEGAAPDGGDDDARLLVTD